MGLKEYEQYLNTPLRQATVTLLLRDDEEWIPKVFAGAFVGGLITGGVSTVDNVEDIIGIVDGTGEIVKKLQDYLDKNLV